MNYTYDFKDTGNKKKICHNNTLKLSGEREIKGLFFQSCYSSV